MLSKTNYKEKGVKNSTTQNRYAIRKLSIGVISALIGCTLLGITTGHRTFAATVLQNTTQAVSTKMAQEDNSTTEDPHVWNMGDDSKTYDGQVVNQINAQNFKLKDDHGKKLKAADGQPLNTSSINNDSFEWTDADGNPIVENPKNVGTYHAKLTDDAVKKLQNDNPGLSVQTGKELATYTIKQGQATAALKGYDSKAEDDTAVSAADLNKDGRIYVDLNIDGTGETKYDLKDGDYAWYNADQDDSTAISASTVKGTYLLELTQQGKNNIINHINNIAGFGTTIVDGQKQKIANVKTTFANTKATYIIYDRSIKKPDNLPEGTVWTPAGWTRTNPDHVVKSASVTLYRNGKVSFKNKTPIKDKFDDLKYSLFGADISATIDKNDMHDGSKILLATIIATNDYSNSADLQLPLSASSTEDGKAIKDHATDKVIGTISVTNNDNGEIDYWLTITNVGDNKYGDDYNVKGLKDYQTGYLDADNDFSKLTNMSKNAHPLRLGDTITQTLTTVNHSYQQKYNIPNDIIDNLRWGDEGISWNPNTWAAANSPILSANYINPALNIHVNATGPINISAKELANLVEKTGLKSYTKAFLIEGSNIDFSHVSTYEKLKLYPVGDKGNVMRDSTDKVTDSTGNRYSLIRNKKDAIKLSDNLALQDIVAQTPDGQSAYSVVQNGGGIIVVIKVNPKDIQVTPDEVISFVKSSRYYNLKANDKNKTLKDTKDFYQAIHYQAINQAVMVNANLIDPKDNSGWGTIHDITPEIAKAGPLKDKGVKYEHGKPVGQARTFRTAKLVYYDVKSNNPLDEQTHTVLSGQPEETVRYSIDMPMGYKFVKINNNTHIPDTDNKTYFKYSFSSNEDDNKKHPVEIYVQKIAHAHTISYTIHDKTTGQVVSENTEMPNAYMMDNTDTGFISNPKDPEYSRCNKTAADKGYQSAIKMFTDKGYIINATESKNKSVVNENGSIDWRAVKDNGLDENGQYHLDIYVKHDKKEVSSDQDWPADVDPADQVPLTKIITRTIKVAGLPAVISPEKQTATFSRTAIVDQVTHKVIGYNNLGKPVDEENSWILANNGWDAYTVSADTTGYKLDSITANGKDYLEVNKDKDGNLTSVANVQPDINKDSDIEVVINYGANNRNVTIDYVDDEATDKQSRVIKRGSLSGQVGQVKHWDAQVPENYVLAGNQANSGDYTFKVNDNKSIEIKVVAKRTETGDPLSWGNLEGNIIVSGNPLTSDKPVGHIGISGDSATSDRPTGRIGIVGKTEQHNLPVAKINISGNPLAIDKPVAHIGIMDPNVLFFDRPTGHIGISSTSVNYDLPKFKMADIDEPLQSIRPLAHIGIMDPNALFFDRPAGHIGISSTSVNYDLPKFKMADIDEPLQSIRPLAHIGIMDPNVLFFDRPTGHIGISSTPTQFDLPKGKIGVAKGITTTDLPKRHIDILGEPLIYDLSQGKIDSRDALEYSLPIFFGIERMSSANNKSARIVTALIISQLDESEQADSNEIKDLRNLDSRKNNSLYSGIIQTAIGLRNRFLFVKTLAEKKKSFNSYIPLHEAEMKTMAKAARLHGADTPIYKSKKCTGIKTKLPKTDEKKSSLSWLGILLSSLSLGSMFINRKRK